jgi:hypothetical protein
MIPTVFRHAATKHCSNSPRACYSTQYMLYSSRPCDVRHPRSGMKPPREGRDH